MQRLQRNDRSSNLFTCLEYRRDVASCGRIIWEGYMGAQEPAFLLRSTVNLEQTGSPRHEHLSTGLYTLMDVICTGCSSPMGWQYLQASQEVNTLLTKCQKTLQCGTFSCLLLVQPFSIPVGCRSKNTRREQHSCAIVC